MSLSPWVAGGVAETQRLLRHLLERDLERIEGLAERFAGTVARGGTLFFCGNGGSAAEAQHLAAELVGRFYQNRRALAAVALTTDTSILTSVGNDYGFDQIFARQIDALGRRGDLLVVMTTSGRSPNVLQAVRAARARGMEVVGMTGLGGAAFARRCDACLVVPSRDPARIQEIHLIVGHLCCERAEAALRSGRRRTPAGRNRPPAKPPTSPSRKARTSRRAGPTRRAGRGRS